MHRTGHSRYVGRAGVWCGPHTICFTGMWLMHIRLPATAAHCLQKMRAGRPSPEWGDDGNTNAWHTITNPRHEELETAATVKSKRSSWQREREHAKRGARHRATPSQR
eukprot:2537422-Prymnesium_polylepis.2